MKATSKGLFWRDLCLPMTLKQYQKKKKQKEKEKEKKENSIFYDTSGFHVKLSLSSYTGVLPMSKSKEGSGLYWIIKTKIVGSRNTPQVLKLFYYFTRRKMQQTGCPFYKSLPIFRSRCLYDPAIPLLGIHTGETRRERDTSTPMFIAALFIIAKQLLILANWFLTVWSSTNLSLLCVKNPFPINRVLGFIHLSQVFILYLPFARHYI